MNGWPSVAIIVVAQTAAAIILIRLAARRWWDYLVIAVCTAALVRPTLNYITGDISRYLPDAIWSEGGDGKDQIIYVSAASTILLPLIVSALAVLACKQIWRALQRADKRNVS
jgi:hypothetical protein